MVVPSVLHEDKKLDRSLKLRSFCVHIMRINLFRHLQWLLSNATNNINQIAKATNTTGVIYKKDIDYMREKIEKLSKEIWDIHSLLLNRNK
uniref:plasmid mobilization relaxosome protein MobC n=1 Tax=Peptoniphilus grossensis TaxID=1465756 RepID=UPI0036F1E93C